MKSLLFLASIILPATMGFSQSVGLPSDTGSGPSINTTRRAPAAGAAGGVVVPTTIDWMALFRALDTNGDGRLSQEEFSRLATMNLGVVQVPANTAVSGAGAGTVPESGSSGAGRQR